MQIVEQTPTKLVLRDRLEFWCILFFVMTNLFFGVSSIVSGIVIGWSFFNIIGLGYAMLGLVTLPSLRICTYTFDKTLGYAIIKQQRLFKSKVFKYPIEVISGLEIRGNGVYLVLESGKRRVHIASYTTYDERTHQRTAEAIAAFLNVRNYGFESFPDPDSEQLVLRTREEEIAHWQAVLQTNSSDADAFFNLGLALYGQDKIRNRKQVRNYVKQAIALYKAQGDGEQASQVARFWTLMSWYVVEEAYTVLKLEDGTYLKIEGGTHLKVVEHTQTKLILRDPKAEPPPTVISGMIGCFALLLVVWSSTWFFSGLFVVRDCLEQLYTAQLQIKGECSQGLTSGLSPLFGGIFCMGVGVLPIISLVLCLGSSSTCTFDKILGSVIITNKNLLRIKVIKCSLYEVVDVQIEERTKAKENHRYQVYRVVLVLSSGKRIPLTPFPQEARKHPHQIIDLIQRFLSD